MGIRTIWKVPFYPGSQTNLGLQQFLLYKMRRKTSRKATSWVKIFSKSAQYRFDAKSAQNTRYWLFDPFGGTYYTSNKLELRASSICPVWKHSNGKFCVVSSWVMKVGPNANGTFLISFTDLALLNSLHGKIWSFVVPSKLLYTSS